MGNKKRKKKNASIGATGVLKFPQNAGALEIIIETPKGSRNKYAYDPERGLYKIDKVLPAGMSFPCDFGFVPHTLSEDGDPLDVLLLMDEPAFPGCLAECRLIGVIEAEQEKDGEMQRNDRLLAVENSNHSYAGISHVDDLPANFVRELGEFFVQYHQLRGGHFRVLGIKGPRKAFEVLQKAHRAAA